MSEIIDNYEAEISGTVTIKATIIPDMKSIQGTCEFCSMWTYNGYDMLKKITCETCREKIIKRIQLILKFE